VVRCSQATPDVVRHYLLHTLPRQGDIQDTSEHLRIYTTSCDPSFMGLTGSEEQRAQVRTAYDVMAGKQVGSGTSAGYLLALSTYSYAIDWKGWL
jgi:cytochrome oxidase Cu insertion factor (SCO1/SenC/PrrC family)